MVEAKPNCIRIAFVVANVWLWSLAAPVGNAGPKTCDRYYSSSIYDKLNFSADGLQRLRASATIMQNSSVVLVTKLITPYPDSVLLLLFDEYVNTVQYWKYNDRFFRIPAGCKLSDISISTAPQLQKVAVEAPNGQLHTLTLFDTGMVTLPDSFLNLLGIRTLMVQRSLLQTVSLDPLANSSNLTVLMLGNNRVMQLVVSSNRDLVLPVKELSLTDNLLEYIDGVFFYPLKHLVNLSLRGNRLKRIDGPIVSFPRLTICNLDGNQMTHLNVSNWRAPQLEELYMSFNNLTQLPVGLEKLANLTVLNLSENKLSTIDLRRLEGHPKLQTIDVSGNLLQTVRVSQQGQVTLRLLEMVDLAQNQISQIDLTRWNMPMLRSLRLAFNRLESLPDLFKLFPKLQKSVAYGNPLRCNSLRQLSSYLAENKLTVDTTAYGQPCVTNSSFKVSTGAVICCMG